MSYRVKLVINNKLSIDLTCASISGPTFDNLAVGQVAKAGQSITFTNETNDRVYVTWKDANGMQYQMGMTCPQSSSNSAAGYTTTGFGDPGLQKYAESGTPCVFTYNIGTPTQASWGNPQGPANQSQNPKYGELS